MGLTDKLDLLMKEKKINKAQLARESGVPYTTIDGFYKKGSDNAKLSTLKKLCSYFGCTLDYLADDDINNQPTTLAAHFDGEEITVGFKLVRDALIFTNKRIIFTNKQGATGIKMSVESINLFSVVDVTMETAGFGFDDSELTFTYIKTANLKAHQVQYISHKLEFPKKYNVQPLYKLLQELAYNNCLRINGLD